MLIKAKYHEIRKDIETGDVLGFGGRGAASIVIKTVLRTNVSHVGMVMRSVSNTGERLNQIIESTTLDNYSGVVVNRLSNRLREYDGDVWWLPLKKEFREKAKGKEAYQWMKKQKGKPYDTRQAIGSGLDFLINNKEDFSKLFCSELISAFYEKVGIIDEINSSEVTPIDLCMFNLYEKDYYQLKGKKKEIKGYNTIPPGDWVV